MVETSTSNDLQLLQNFISAFIAMLDGEAAIPDPDRQLTTDNIDSINEAIADMLSQFIDIVNAAPAP